MNKVNKRRSEETVRGIIEEFKDPSVNYVAYKWDSGSIPPEILDDLTVRFTQRGYPVTRKGDTGIIIGRPVS